MQITGSRNSTVRIGSAFSSIWSYRWMRPAIVVGVLALALVVGLSTAKANSRLGMLGILIPSLVPLGLGLWFAVRRPEWGPFLILVSTIFVPWYLYSVPTGTGSPVVVSMALTGAYWGVWVLTVLVEKKGFRLWPSSVNKPVVGIALVAVISLFWSTGLRDPLVVVWRSFPFVQAASAAVMVLLPGAFVLAANHITHARQLQAMVGVMLFAGVLGLIKQYEIVDIAMMTDGLFTMWVVTLSAGLAFFWRRGRTAWRGLLLLLAGLWVYWGVSLHIEWLAGWLSGFVTLSVLSFMRSKKLGALLALGVVIYVAVNADYYFGNVFQSESQVSGTTRLAAWEVNWRVTKDHLLFGTGPAGYAAYYMSYFPTDAMATHSNYIDILAQVGVVGFTFYAWFFIALAWKGYRLSRRLKGRGDFLEALANAAFAGTIGSIVMMAFGDWVVPFAYTQGIAGFGHTVYGWLFMGTLLAVERLTSTASGRPEVSEHSAAV